MKFHERPDISVVLIALRHWCAKQRAIYQTRQQVRRIRVWRGK
jgi:hypothetical protein